MRLFEGLPHSDYQDILRALGRYLDARDATEVRLLEREEGLLVQARLRSAPAGFQAWDFPDGDLLALLHAAYDLRGQGPQRGGGHLGLPYQDLLRAVGRVLDRERWCDLRLLAEPDGVLVQVRGVEHKWRGFATYRLTAAQVRALVADAPLPSGQGAFGHPLGRP